MRHECEEFLDVVEDHLLLLLFDVSQTTPVTDVDVREWAWGEGLVSPEGVLLQIVMLGFAKVGVCVLIRQGSREPCLMSCAPDGRGACPRGSGPTRRGQPVA